MVGSNGVNPKDYKRALVEATMQEVREKTGLRSSLAMPGGLLHPASEDEPKEVQKRATN